MKNKKVIYFFFLLFFLFMDFEKYSALDGTNIIDRVISETKSQVVEYGIKINFSTTDNIEKILNNVVKDIGVKNFKIKEVKKSNNSYYMKFYGVNIEGYIESYNAADSNKVIIEIIKKGVRNNLDVLLEKVSKSISDKAYNSRFYSYVKLKTSMDSSLELVNSKISKILMDSGAINVDSLKINNGYTSMAYTKGYRNENLNQRYKSINYAVCEYVSGNYIIIGTPEIFISY